MSDNTIDTTQPVLSDGEQTWLQTSCSSVVCPAQKFAHKGVPVQTQTSIYDVEDDTSDEEEDEEPDDDNEIVQPRRCGACWTCYDICRLIYPYMILGGVYAIFLVIWHSVLPK